MSDTSPNLAKKDADDVPAEAANTAAKSDEHTVGSNSKVNETMTTNHAQKQPTNQNEEDLIKEMRNFDNLLKMLSVYRDNPDLRGNPNDKNIEEIAKVLSNFIGDDPDNFLKDSDEEEVADST
jgi:hypothetical protein